MDDSCSAGRSNRCAWRALSRRTHTHDTCERRNDVKPSSEDTVVDVEVDRCIDENLASNRDKVALLSPKLHRSILWLENLNPNYNLEPVQTSPKQASRELQFYRFSITKGGTYNGLLVPNSFTILPVGTPSHVPRRRVVRLSGSMVLSRHSSNRPQTRYFTPSEVRQPLLYLSAGK